ncbi:hypothetical protein [Micromonospora sp. NPDC049282]|uniref:hypothetical protein n=1 Tax=Micromonospora sp. NPDC049282 TaxID=3364269 RepID=UPI0037174EA8
MTANWPVMVVALVGVVGTLGAALSTQVLTTRREERRWIREREAEQERWQRERQDRIGQWQREDDLRHQEARFEIYAEYMKTIWIWGRRANKARLILESDTQIMPNEWRNKLVDIGGDATNVLALLELVASTAVRDSARKCCDIMSLFGTEILKESLDAPSLLSLHDEYRASARRTVELMRAERGLNAT